MPTRPVKCQGCTKVWLAEFEEHCEAALECPSCGEPGPNLYNALLAAAIEVNDKKITVDFPTEIGVGIVPNFCVGLGPQGLTLYIAGEFHTWPWGTVFHRMGITK